MRRLILDDDSLAAAVAEAVDTLRSGALVVLPTETVYGLAADAANGEAVARIFAAKGRPRFNPLICHVSGVEMAARYGRLDAKAELLTGRFWPGPLTLVLPLASGARAHPLAIAGLSTIALRAPRGPAHAVIGVFGGAVAAPSANRSGRLSPTRADHAIAQLGDDAELVLDAGPCAVGLESTIVSLVGDAPRLLRPGGLAAETIEAALGQPLARAAPGEAIAAPGMLASHYAPRLPLRLDATAVAPAEALLAFGPTPLPGSEAAEAIRNLSPTADLVEAAKNLFDYLAELDATDATAIAAMPVPECGLGAAINDRLRRAAVRGPKDSVEAPIAGAGL